MHWSTTAMMELLGDPKWDIELDEPGGDVDSEVIIFRATGAGSAEHLEGEPDERIFISVLGFKAEGYVSDPANTDIDYVVMSDGMDVDGGLTTGDAKTCAMYGDLMARLRGAGFSVVPNLDAYF